MLSNDERFDEYNLTESKDFRIALDKDAENRNIAFEQFAELNGMKYKTVWCENAKEQQKAVESGKADALILSLIHISSHGGQCAFLKPQQLRGNHPL